MKARAREATDPPGPLAALVGESGSTPTDAAAPDGVAENPIIEARYAMRLDLPAVALAMLWLLIAYLLVLFETFV